MSKTIFEIFGLKKEPKHPIVARMELFKAYDAPINEAFGIWITPITEDGTNDKTAPRLYLPMGQIRELIEGKFSDGFVQQYPSINDSMAELDAKKKQTTPFKKVK